MKISYNLTGDARKNLVNAISTELNAETHYCGAPTFNYTIGDYTIDKTGTVSGPDNRGLIADLEGLYSLIPAEKTYDTEKGAPQPENADDHEPRYTDEEFGLGVHRCDPAGENGMQADDVPETDEPDPEDDEETDEAYGLTVNLPREGYSNEAIDNLKRLVASKASLIKKSLGLTKLPIKVDDKVISFPWYSEMPTPEVINATSHLIGKLAGFAKLHRVNNKPDEPTENEKFAFRTFLIRLGFIGAEYKEIRKTLLRNMEGNGAFKSGSRPEKDLPDLPDLPTETGETSEEAADND
ncbi:MAG: virulence protein [Eubacteriales bacterium]|nr:virulence protein [Eubacteriales bacterium]